MGTLLFDAHLLTLNKPFTYTERVRKHYMSFGNASIVLSKSFFKVGHWDPSTRENVNNNSNKKKNKPVQLNYLKAIDWTGEFWQELQCSVKTKKGKAKKLQGRKITVVTIEVGRNNLKATIGTMTFALQHFRSQEI